MRPTTLPRREVQKRQQKQVNQAGQKITVWGEQQTTTASMLINEVEFEHDSASMLTTSRVPLLTTGQ